MKRMNRHLVFLLFYGVWVLGIFAILGTSGCTASKNTLSSQQEARIDRLLNTKNFAFEAEFVMPTASQAYLSAANLGFATIRGTSPTQLNVSGEGYYIKIYGDSVQAYLPYFGVSDNVSDFANTRRGIELTTVMEDVEIKPVKTGKQLQFFAKEGFERFRFLMSITPELNSRVSVFSPQRDVIRYTGKVKETEGER